MIDANFHGLPYHACQIHMVDACRKSVAGSRADNKCVTQLAGKMTSLLLNLLLLLLVVV